MARPAVGHAAHDAQVPRQYCCEVAHIEHLVATLDRARYEREVYAEDLPDVQAVLMTLRLPHGSPPRVLRELELVVLQEHLHASLVLAGLLGRLPLEGHARLGVRHGVLLELDEEAVAALYLVVRPGEGDERPPAVDEQRGDAHEALDVQDPLGPVDELAAGAGMGPYVLADQRPARQVVLHPEAEDLHQPAQGGRLAEVPRLLRGLRLGRGLEDVRVRLRPLPAGEREPLLQPRHAPAVPGRALHQAVDRGLQGGVQVALPGPEDPDDAVPERVVAVHPARPHAGVREDLDRHAPEQPHVGRGLGYPVARGHVVVELGRHVVGPAWVAVDSDLPRAPEVDELHHVVGLDQNVLRLEVAVDPAHGVQILQSTEQLPEVLQPLGQREGPLHGRVLLVHVEEVEAQGLYSLQYHARPVDRGVGRALEAEHPDDVRVALGPVRRRLLEHRELRGVVPEPEAPVRVALRVQDHHAGPGSPVVRPEDILLRGGEVHDALLHRVALGAQPGHERRRQDGRRPARHRRGRRGPPRGARLEQKP
mmetsp:Transcript_105014/g.297116  ORF Transcript_105014/g.297116 Transcript_105014/m.297116 type:complete len:536 (-) Transcript_105014:9-1616(-)